MTTSAPFTGKELEREVEYAIVMYPRPGNCTTRVEYSMALEIRRLERIVESLSDYHDVSHQSESGR